MRRLTLLLLLLPVWCFGQAVPGCGTFTASGPITATSNSTISGKSIDLGGAATVGINIPANVHDVHITKCIIKNSTALSGLIRINSGCYNITIDTCFFEAGWRGINATTGTTHNIHIWYNYFHNINDPNVLTSHTTDGGGSSVQLNNCNGTSIQVLDNKSYHDVSGSGIGDQFSVFQCNGTPASPIRVCRNQALNGSTNIPANGYVGAVGGDVGGSYQRIDSNIFVNVGSVVAQIQGGTFIEMSYNTGFLAQASYTSVGMAYGNYSGSPSNNCTMAFNNVRCIQPNGNVFNYWFDNNNVTAPAGWASNTTSTSLNANILPNPLWPPCNPTVLPPNISYSGSPYTYTVGTPIASLVPSNSGGNTTGYSVSPSLPLGIGINSVSGIVSGVPTTVTATATYTVRAVNSAGQGTFPLVMTVNPTPVNKPVISYSPNAVVATVNTSIPALTPANTGSPVVTWGISPALPSGLTFSNGIISGASTITTSNISYTISATNSAGTGNATVTIQINPVRPNISYSGTPYTFTAGSTIIPILPSNSGGPISSFSISPSLPSSLIFSTGTGQISGAPSASQTATTYNIIAQNVAGSSTFPISITVIPPAVSPPNISYSPSSQTGTINVPITSMAPINVGGAATGFTISPSLPVSLNFNTSNGVVSGTATVTSTSTSYTIIGSNSGGSSTTHITLQINPIPAPSITYPASSYALQQNTSITITPVNVGGVGTYSVTSGTLPLSLSLDSSTGIISGNLTAIQNPSNVVITCTNTTGSSPFTISFAVNAAPTNHWYLINNSWFGPVFQ